MENVTTAQPIRVAFLAHCQNAFTSRILRGMTREAEIFGLGHPVTRDFLVPLGTTECPADLWSWNPSAIVAFLSCDLDRLLDHARQRKIPIVHTTSSISRSQEAVVVCDAFSVYECVHNHFQDLHIADVVQVHYDEDDSWNVTRARYQEFCFTRGHPVQQLLLREEPPELYSPTHIGSLPDELFSLIRRSSKRMGVFSQQHFTGPYLARTLTKMGVGIPDEVAIIGSDDFDVGLWCNPSMTNVRLPVEEMGAQAIRIALEMVMGKPAPRGHVRIPGAHLVVGGSTKTRQSSDVDLVRALEHIEQYACEGITVGDIVRLTQPVTRQTFSREFQKWTGKSPGAAIRDRQMSEAKRLLRDSTVSITTVALACGFCDDIEFRRKFRSQTGLSPRSYRKQFTMNGQTGLAE